MQGRESCHQVDYIVTFRCMNDGCMCSHIVSISFCCLWKV